MSFATLFSWPIYLPRPRGGGAARARKRHRRDQRSGSAARPLAAQPALAVVAIFLLLSLPYGQPDLRE
jgi:hypothetical protein